MASSPIPVDQLALAPVYRLEELQQRKIVRIIQPITSLGIAAAVEAATDAVRGALDAKADQADLAGKAAAGANSDITSLSGLATALSVDQGGTGAKTSSGARAALGLGNVDDTSDATKAASGNPIGDAIAQALRPGAPGFNAAFSAAVAAWMGSLPTASSNPDDPAPVPAGSPYKLGPGGPVVIAQ